MRESKLIVVILVYLACFKSCSQVWTIEKLLKQSFFKSCSVSNVSDDNSLDPENFISLPSPQQDRYYVMKLREPKEEWREWYDLPATITSNHPNLAIGLMRGMPQARMWARRTDLMWTVTEDHPRNNRSQCLAASTISSKHPVQLYKPTHAQQAESFLLKKNNVLIHETGIIASQCGYYQVIDGCETKFQFIGKKWWKNCQSQLKESRIRFRTVAKSDSPLLFPEYRSSVCIESARNVTWQYHQKVFVATALWDSNYHHFLIDTVLRFIRFLDFLKRNPDWKIHIRRSELDVNSDRYQNRSIAMRRKVIELLGINESQFINGPVIAEQVVTTRGIKCNMFIHHALDVRYLAKKMMHLAVQKAKDSLFKTHSSVFPFVIQQQHKNISIERAYPRKILIQHRVCNEDSCKKDWRGWNDQQFLSMVNAFQAAFPFSEILTLSDFNSSKAACLHCEIILYKDVDILVGEHGAGITNLIFMQPNTLLVEIVGVFDGRMLPLCGYHGPLASIFGVHHLIHYFDWKAGQSIGALEVANRTFDYYEWLRLDRSKPFPFKAPLSIK